MGDMLRGRSDKEPKVPYRVPRVRLPQVVFGILSVVSLIGAWSLVSYWLTPRVFPAPMETIEFLWKEWERGRIVRHVAATMNRVLISFGISMLIGIIVGLVMGTSRKAEALGGAWLLTGLAIPRIVPIVVAYILIGLNETAAIVAITVSVIPTVVSQVLEGAKALDHKLIQMARVFGRTPLAIVTKVVGPQLFPYIAGTARGAMSLAWKMVVFAELMGRSNGVGYQIAFYFQMFDLRGILAYGLTMIVTLYAIDYLIMLAWERFAFRWRPTPVVWAD